MNFKHHIVWLFVIVMSLMIPHTTHADLTTTQQFTIQATISSRADRQSESTVDNQITKVQNKIAVLLNTNTLNTFTTDVLMYIYDSLEELRPVQDIEDDDEATEAPQDEDETTTPWVDSSILSLIAQYDTDMESVVLAGDQSRIIAEFELLARLEPFELEDLEIQASLASLDGVIAQMHLYDQDGVLLASDRPNSDGLFDFTISADYTLPIGTTKIYAMVDTMVVGYFGNSDQEKFEFTLRISAGEAQWVYSSTAYSLAQSDISDSISIQSVLVSDILLVDESLWARVSTQLTHGTNTLGILEITTADSPNKNTTTPQDLDIILDSLTIELSDNTVSNSVIGSIRLERLDRSAQAIQGVTAWNDQVIFDLSGSQDAHLIANWETAIYRILGDVSLTANQWESVKISINDLRSWALEYRSSDDESAVFTAVDSEYFQLDGVNLSD